MIRGLRLVTWGEQKSRHGIMQRVGVPNRSGGRNGRVHTNGAADQDKLADVILSLHEDVRTFQVLLHHEGLIQSIIVDYLQDLFFGADHRNADSTAGHSRLDDPHGGSGRELGRQKSLTIGLCLFVFPCHLFSQKV